jgi:hypothetical protein
MRIEFNCETKETKYFNDQNNEVSEPIPSVELNIEIEEEPVDGQT